MRGAVSCREGKGVREPVVAMYGHRTDAGISASRNAADELVLLQAVQCLVSVRLRVAGGGCEGAGGGHVRTHEFPPRVTLPTNWFYFKLSSV